MNRFIRLVAVICAFAATASASPLKIVTTTADLADIAGRVAGNRATVEALAKGNQNPHFVDAKPSLIVKLMKADAFIQTGLDLEVGWAPLLLRGARNRKVLPGGPGHIDASAAVTPMEIPTTVSRADGDVHPHGNPHYMMNPENAAPVARLIADRLKVIDPTGAAEYDANLASFLADLNEKLIAWKSAMAPLKGATFVSYHRDWIYFARCFGLEPLGEIEPKPGIPPAGHHTAALIRTMKERGAKFVIINPWYERRTAEMLAKECGARLCSLAHYPGGAPNTDGYLATVDYNVAVLTGTAVTR